MNKNLFYNRRRYRWSYLPSATAVADELLKMRQPKKIYYVEIPIILEATIVKDKNYEFLPVKIIRYAAKNKFRTCKLGI